MFGGLLVLVGAVTLGLGYHALTSERLPPVLAANAQTGDSGAAGADGPELRNSVSRQAADWGVQSCLPQIARISDFLTTGVRYAALSLRGRNDADSQIFSAAIAAGGRTIPVSISTLSATPTADGCNSSYQTVASFALSCQETHAGYFANFSERMEFGDEVAVYRSNTNSFVYLLPVADVGCTAVKTEVLY